MTTPSGGLVGDATIRVRADTDPAQTAIQAFALSAQRSLVAVGQGAGSAALSLGRIGATVGSAVPALASVAATAQSIAPAAAGAATAFLAIKVASSTVRLAMIGVGEAISAAFATGEDSAKEFEEALEKLSPSAREFVIAVRDMRGELVGFQQSIQEELFLGLDEVFRNTAESVLPVLQENLLITSRILGDMAAGAGSAAAELAEDGTLGLALEGANQGLTNLQAIPGQVIAALTRLAAAGTPVFDQLTEVASNAATKITDRLASAFESGELQKAVRDAIEILGDLFDVALDVFGIIQNVLGAVSAEGEDLFQVIGTVTASLRDFTGTEQFQEALGALAETMGVLAETVAPLLFSALGTVLPVFINLAEPVQELIESLGSGLAPIIRALDPVLNAASESLGQLITAITPLFPIVGNLIAQLGPILVPILEAVGDLAEQLAPVFLRLATTLSGALQPILAALPGVLGPILDAFSELVTALLPLLDEFIIALGPSLDELSLAFVDLLIALEPVITALILLTTKVLVELTPLLTPLIGLVARLSQVFSNSLVAVLTGVVIPALNVLAALLRGNFSGALDLARQAVSRLASGIVSTFSGLTSRVSRALGDLGSALVRIMADALRRMGNTAADGIRIITRIIGSLPGLARSALGNLGSLLFGAGRALIRGFIDGIRSAAQGAIDAVTGIIGSIGGLFPGSPAEEGPFSGSGYVLFRGQSLSEDFAQGIRDRASAVERAARDLISSASVGISVGDVPVARTLPVGPVVQRTAAVAPTAVSITLVNQGVMGSRAEVLEWLTGAIEELRRRQRLPIGVQQ